MYSVITIAALCMVQRFLERSLRIDVADYRYRPLIFFIACYILWTAYETIVVILSLLDRASS